MLAADICLTDLRVRLWPEHSILLGLYNHWDVWLVLAANSGELSVCWVFCVCRTEKNKCHNMGSLQDTDQEVLCKAVGLNEWVCTVASQRLVSPVLVQGSFIGLLRFDPWSMLPILFTDWYHAHWILLTPFHPCTAESPSPLFSFFTSPNGTDDMTNSSKSRTSPKLNSYLLLTTFRGSLGISSLAADPQWNLQKW